MLVCNYFPNTVLIARKHRLDIIIKVMYVNCFQAILDPEAAKVLSKLALDQFNCCAVAIFSIDPFLRTKLPNNIMIYSEK